MHDPIDVLQHWAINASSSDLQSLGEGSSFSDASVWRVRTKDGNFVVRRWGERWTLCRLSLIQLFTKHLAAAGCPTPLPCETPEGAHCFGHGPKADRCFWTVTSWLPGAADYWRDQRQEKLVAAMTALARLHDAAATFPHGDGMRDRGFDASPAFAKRSERLTQLCSGELQLMRDRLHRGGDEPEHAVSLEALALIEQTAGAQRRAVARFLPTPLPLQWRHGDLWHDHVLFSGGEVTGIIDFGAASIDSPAGDIARLIGSFVGDDVDGWRQALAAYQTVRPLSDDEVAAVRLFDTSGTVISAANWIGWLRDVSGLNRPVIKDRAAAVERLQRLVERLRVLANWPCR
jgi:Ser/Thr protein kinase RdoA (MazF antagonist)